MNCNRNVWKFWKLGSLKWRSLEVRKLVVRSMKEVTSSTSLHPNFLTSREGPAFPPVFFISRMSPMTMRLSTALTMS